MSAIRFPGLAERLRQRLQALGFWKIDRPDVSRFCRERGYLPAYIYAYLAGSTPTYDRLAQLARDLNCSLAWLLLGEGPEELGDLARRPGPAPRASSGGLRPGSRGSSPAGLGRGHRQAPPVPAGPDRMRLIRRPRPQGWPQAA